MASIVILHSVPKTDPSESFDEPFDLRARHPDFQEYFDRNNELSAEAVEALPCQLDIPYGNHPLQAVDYFPASQGHSPIVVFIHGGYWRALDKSAYRFIARPFHQAGCATCQVNYRLAPEVGLEEIVNDVIAALQSIENHATAINGNPRALYLSGHSAGGHLALIAAMRLQQANDPLLSSIKGILSVSGLFDLDPIRQSFLNEDLQLDPATVAKFSPILNETFQTDIPMDFAVGASETEAFITQSRDINERMLANGNRSQFTLLPDLNHFNIVYELGKTDGVLTKRLLETIGSNQ